jgi:hypothetical protein
VGTFFWDMKSTYFSDFASCRLVEVHRGFVRTCCLHLLGCKLSKVHKLQGSGSALFLYGLSCSLVYVHRRFRRKHCLPLQGWRVMWCQEDHRPCIANHCQTHWSLEINKTSTYCFEVSTSKLNGCGFDPPLMTVDNSLHPCTSLIHY